ARHGGRREVAVLPLQVDTGEDMATEICSPPVVCRAAGIEDLAIVVRPDRPARQIKGHTGHRRVRVDGGHNGCRKRRKPGTLVDYEAGDLKPHGAKRAADHPTVDTAAAALVQEP